MSYKKICLLTGSILSLSLSLSATSAFANDHKNSLNQIDEITVVGSVQNIDDIAGAVSFIGQEELKKQNYSDIHRVLRNVPGVNVQEEDGYGLRPNIGLRGSGAERSGKVVIMEDGVLMAPAPYASPSAYYFPVTGRMNAVEVTKGPATTKYGPNTTAGAINFFSTPIPTEEAAAHANILVSDLGHNKVHAWAGGRKSLGAFDAGFLVETYQDHADGFKTVPNGNTGFDIEDYVAKFGLYSNNGDHSLELKLETKDEVSDETYLGLLQEDFDVDPYQRYAASQIDQMNNDHQTYQATHRISLGENWGLTTIAYRTEFARNWYKLHDGVTEDNVDLLKGLVDSVAGEELRVRANNRTYYSKGIQTALSGSVKMKDITHNLVASARFHKDSVDRFQHQDGYQMQNRNLVRTMAAAPGTQANRLSYADAIALYVEDRIEWDKLSVTLGGRLETIDTDQTRWNGADRIDADISSERDNSYSEFLPSIAAIYDIDESLAVFGGVHKGFAAPSVSSREGTDPERSIVYEAGVRYGADSGVKLEVIGYFNDYSNMLGDCTNFSPCSTGDVGDSNNGGDVNVKGLEVTASHEFATDGSLSFPVGLTYAYTDAKFKNDFSSDYEAWGDVLSGDELPYVPEHQLTLNLGVTGNNWGVNSLLNTVSKTRSIAGQGDIADDETIDGRTLVDANAYYQLSDSIRLTVKAENLFDEIYRAARRPSGIRPGKPREIFAGISLDF